MSSATARGAPSLTRCARAWPRLCHAIAAPVRGDALAHRLHQLAPLAPRRRTRSGGRSVHGAGAVFRADDGVGHRARRRPPVRAQAIADPGDRRTPHSSRRPSEATAVDAELATLAVTRARSGRGEGVREAGARRARRARARAHRDGPDPPDRLRPRPRPDGADAARRPPDAMKAVAALRSQPPATFDAAFVAAMIAQPRGGGGPVRGRVPRRPRRRGQGVGSPATAGAARAARAVRALRPRPSS